MTSVQQRCISARDAASYCGVTLSGFYSWVSKGVVPGPIPGTHRWDRKAIDAALDKHCGLIPEEQETDLQRWKRERDARRTGT